MQTDLTEKIKKKTVQVIFQKKNTNLFCTFVATNDSERPSASKEEGFNANMAMFRSGQPVSNAIMAKCQALAGAKCNRRYRSAHQGCRLPAPTPPRRRGAADRAPPSQFSLFQGIITPNNVSRNVPLTITATFMLETSSTAMRAPSESARATRQRSSTCLPPQPPRVPIARPRIQSSAERAAAPCRLTE